MTSVEKRRSGRKSGGHRKHSDGGYSDTSSGGSFLDETDREVSNLTDRAFRSLCIGDEAVYNDSDLCSSSPCTQRDRQLAFSHSSQDRDGEDREREELKRAAHDSFSLRMQQYGQEWIHGGMYGAEIHRDPQWGVYGEKTQGRVSATFQRSLMEMSQQEKSLNEEQLSFFSNGATELSLQQRRSRSRVSSLIRAFNSEGQREGAGMDGKIRDCNDETSWDKSALMSIQRELSEFSTSYQQNFDSGHFPPAGPFSSRDNFYSSEVAAVAHMNAASSFMRSSHSKHSMLTQVNCNSNFFIHSEFSPFRVWRDHNRFPFQQGEVSGFMHCSEFPKWCKTPMYKELSLETQPQGPSMFEERGIRHQRNTLAPMVPPTSSRSTSASTMLQKASSVEKRCESELAGHYPQRTRTQSLGSNRLPSQRPSTASPTIEMSRRVRDTISSVKALQQKIKMMTEQNIAAEVTANKKEVLYSNNSLIPIGNNAVTAAPVHALQETSEVQQCAVPPQPVEHPPVRAGSRGATPDVRMSSYKSKATSLLFNLKDNRKRVKSTYSPTKFKGLETLEKNKQPAVQEHRDIVIDIPEFPDPDIQIPQVDVSNWTDEASHHHANQYQRPGQSLTTMHSQPATAYTGQNSEYISSEYQAAQMQGEMVHHSGFTSYIPENDSSNQLPNGQNLHEDLSSFTPYKQSMIENIETMGGDVNRHKPSYRATEMPRLNAENNQIREYVIGKGNTQQHFNEAVGREYTKVDRYQQLKENKHDYSNVSSQDRWRQTNNQDTEMLSLNAATSPWKQDISALMEKDQHAQDYQKTATIKEELSSPRDKNIRENTQSINKELKQIPQNPAHHGQQQHGAFKDKSTLQKYHGQNVENEVKENYLTPNYSYNDHEHRNKQTFYSDEEKTVFMQETSQKKQYSPMLKDQSLQSKEGKQLFEHNMQKNSLSVPDKALAPTAANQVKNRQFVEVKAAEDAAEQIKAVCTQAELEKAQHWAQVEQPKTEQAKVILACQTSLEKVKEELTEQDSIKQANKFNVADKAQVEHNEEEQRRKKQSGGKKPEQAREEHLKEEQTRVQNVTEVPRNVTEEAGAEHTRQEQSERVKAEQADAERLKEEHIKTELAKSKQPVQARTEQAKTQLAQQERIKSEQLEMEAEQVKVKAELAEAEHRKTEQVQLQQMKLQQANTGQEETKAVGGNVKAEHNVEKVREKKAEEDSVEADQVNAEQPKTETGKAKEANIKQTKLEQTKVELAKELIKTQKIQEWSAKSTAKITMSQKVKSEPSRVEQVKTELAKAKAELAKIKEKMKGEQKEKIMSTVITKEDDTAKKDVSFRADINENEEQDPATKINQQKKDSVGSRNGKDGGADDYQSIREKYGLTNAVSTHRNKESPARKVSSNDDSVTSALALDKVETLNNKTSKDEYNPTSKLATPKTENKENVGNIKSNEVTESNYIYTESSKEFKLSSVNYSPTGVDKRTKSDTVTDKVKDGVDRLGKGEPVKQADVSQQRSGLVKPLERKPRSSEHSVFSGVTPPKALYHKERAQTKQEILTSKIKAHAEKEISAIKEKGFALRDGFTSKNSTKHLLGSQSINIRQRPPSQEVSRRHESTMPNNTTPKHQMGTAGIQVEPVKSISLSSTAATTSQILDVSQKQVPNETIKSIDTVPEAQPAGSTATSTDGGLIENQKKEDQSGIKSPTQNKDGALDNKEKQEVKHEENSEGLMSKIAINTEQLNKKKEDPSQATSKHEVTPEDSSPAVKLVFGQNETSVADDSLQIMGIMVTVRERMGNSPADVSTQKQTHAKDHSNAKPDKCHHSLGVEVNKENESSAELSTGDAKDRVAQESHPTVNEDKVGMNNHPENMQETSTRTNNVTEKRTTPQQESYIHARPQREIQLQEPLTENEVPPMVTVPAKNKVLAETQPCFYKQNIITREKKDHTNETPRQNSANIMTKNQEGINTEEKNPLTTLTDDVNETFKAKLVNTGIDYKDDFNRVDAETRIKHDVQPSVKNDMTTVINPSKSSNIDDKSAPLVEEKRHDSTRLKSFSKTSPSNQLDENEIRHVPSKHQHKETHIKESNKVDSDVHIDSIAIRVVPAVIEKDNLEVMGKQITAVPSDAVAANEHKQVESSSPDETVSTVNKEDESKDSTPTNSEEQMKDNLEGKLGVQYVLTSVRKLADSLKISNHQSSKKATTEIEQKNGTTINTQPVEGDYFQVQGVIETNDEPYNSTNVRDRSDAVSKRGELPGLPNMTTISNESYKKGKHEVFALDQSKSKTVEPCPVSIQNENIKKDNREIEDKNASKPTNYPTETQSSKCENMDTGQAIPIRTHYPERKKINSQPTRENAAKEKPEVQPKPKERVSTIPEISALADYARLKVIVSQETANTMQEFPPSKKEGFFPLIQSRHSRRPVFTADPQDLSMKEKSLSNKTEVSPKVIKEPKPVVFPITEKEHQRTGMFKLGDKERQEKILLDVKDNDSVLETVAKHAHDLAERKKSPQEHIRNEGNKEEIAGAGTQRVSQVDQSVHQPNHNPMQTTTSPSSVNKPRNTVLQHLNPHEKTDFSSTDGMTNLDRDSQIYSMKESKTNLRKGENNEDKDTVAGEDRTDKPRQESLTIPYKETRVKPQSRAKQLDEALGTEEKKREELRIKNIIEESRASLAEEERRAAQREVERRARERETIAIKIKERREKQKEAERRAEEERKAKQAEEERAAQKEEEGRRARQREEEMKMKEFEEKRRAKIEEERKAKLRVEEERMKAIEERRRVKQREEERAALIEEQRRAKQVEEEKRLAHIEEERKRKKSEEERAAQEEQQRRAALIEEEWRKAKQVEEERRLAYIEEERKRKSSEEKAAQITEEKMIKQIQEQRRERQKKEWLRTQTEEERKAVEKEKAIVKQKEEQQAKEERARLLEEASQAAQREEKRIAQEQLQAQREEEIRAKKREEAKIAAQREQERASRVEEQKRAAQRMDALQYYAITSTESERKPRERQLPSPIPCQQRNNTSESTADFGSYSRSHRPHAPASPAPSLPRSNTSSPALGAKPLMFRVKDNTIRGSSFTKSVKPRFHKNFGENFRVGSPMERGDEEQEIVRRNTGTPIHPDTATRHTAIKESSNLQPTSSSQDYSVPLPHHRPYSRRSIILDEDESRSVFSNMSEDVESFVTSTTDLADVRGLYDYERPESACSFSSELSRLGKPPVVPPKSEKALLRAKRLTTRRIKKELSKAAADIPAKKSLKEVSSIPSSSSSEVCSSNRHAVASPHFSPPVSLTNAPLRSSLLSSHTEHQPPHRSFHGSPHATTPVSLPVASPHATGPVSLPVASPHATTPVSLPVASPHATGPVSFPVASPHATGSVSLPVASPHATGPVSLPVASPHATGSVSLPVASPHATGPVSFPVASPHVTGPVSLPVASPHATGPVSLPVASPHVTGPVSHSIAPKTVAHVPSSPTLHHANHPAPVTQYHVESSYPQSYPLTQRKVLQDLGSGQYFVVDVPVQVKTKTFFDPETGKYVQLNVRESGQSTTQPQSQQTYPQPQLQPQMQVKQQQQPLSQASPAGKPFVVYQGYHGYPQSAGISSVHPQSSSSGMSAPMTPSQDQLPGGHRYSPEKTPYMDTVNDKDKTHNTGYNTHGLYECDSQLAGSLVCDNNISAHSRYQSRDIITMGDLEDFMEVSDW